MINFSGKAAELSNTRFKFDLDSDGAGEDVFFVAQGSGFLALDKNRDGRVNNGGELFGPSTGNGFTELSSLDSDGNSWIDESDTAYKDLRVWTKDSNGKDVLTGLKEAGAAAIYLSYADTLFGLKTQDNVLGAEVARTSVYAKQDGNVGTIQQIDLVA